MRSADSLMAIPKGASTMKPAIAREYHVVERRKLHVPLALFVGVMCFSGGFLAGDQTADRRFEERAASIVDYVAKAREDLDHVRESLKRGCYDFAIKKR